jgi:hypothetical protein
MDKFRYYIDLGSGYQLIDVYDNTLELLVDKSVSDMIASKELTGGISFVGQLAEDTFAKRLTGHKVPFKIEEYNGTTWNLLHECYVDIRGKYQRLSRKISLDSFQEFDKPETKIIEALKTRFNLRDLVVFTQKITFDSDSSLFNIYSDPTSLSEVDYKKFTDIEGRYTSPRFEDPRWDYFYLVGSTGVSPNIVYQWACKSFDFNPNELEGYDKINYKGLNKWVTVTLLGDPVDTINTVFTVENFRLTDVFNAILTAVGSSITYFDIYGEGFDSINIYIGDSTEIANDSGQGLEITLSQIFDLLRNYHRTAWYIDDSIPSNLILKFKWDPLYFFDNTIDWTSETINTDRVEFSDPPLPDIEFFSFLDQNRHDLIVANSSFSNTFSYSSLTLSYFDKGVPTDNNIIDKSVDFYADILGIKRADIESGKPIWINYDLALEQFTVKDSRDLYSASDGVTFGGANGERYSEYTPLYVDNTDKSGPYINAISTNSNTRPIYEMIYNKFINDYSNLSLFSKILFSNSNVGYLNKYIINLKTGQARFFVRFKEINL